MSPANSVAEPSVGAFKIPGWGSISALEVVREHISARMGRQRRSDAQPFDNTQSANRKVAARYHQNRLIALGLVCKEKYKQQATDLDDKER